MKACVLGAAAMRDASDLWNSFTESSSFRRPAQYCFFQPVEYAPEYSGRFSLMGELSGIADIQELSLYF
jgi:hypothetical protein